MESYELCKGRVQDLLQKMEISSAEEGMATLDAFVKDYESSLYNELGRLTRQLHDSLAAFKSDEKIFDLTREVIPSAKERLKYVVELTEKAAQKVLGIVEKCIPISLEISNGASNLHDKWSSIPNSDDLSAMEVSTKGFLSGAKDNAAVLHGNLIEILMAQEYQDITGQIIKKVIDLVQDVEGDLLRLISLTGHDKSGRERDADNIKASGPCVPGIDDRRVYTAGQDEVDQLLSSLGF